MAESFEYPIGCDVWWQAVTHEKVDYGQVHEGLLLSDGESVYELDPRQVQLCLLNRLIGTGLMLVRQVPPPGKTEADVDLWVCGEPQLEGSR